jgi:polyhydroxybutyrate depolymerase
MLERFSTLVVGALLSLVLLPGGLSAQEQCEGLSGVPGTYHLTLVSGGLEREYRLDVPADYVPTVPTPLVFNFHGYTSNAMQQAYITDMPARATERGYIAVHPDGYKRSWNAGTCCGAAVSEDIDDVGFVLDMIEAIASDFCVNRGRIHSTGFSNGGYLSHRLACEVSDVFASVAPDAGLIGIPCAPTRSVPLHQTHGTDDGLVPYTDGVDDVAWWAEQNGCVGTPQIYYSRARTTCARYAGCDSGADVELCTIDGGIHWWYDTRTYSTTDDVLDFFDDHPLR